MYNAGMALDASPVTKVYDKTIKHICTMQGWRFIHHL